MFIGEAPGRLGADQTAIPFHGDTAGHNFERLLAEAGIDRNAVFVTNAVLCNPRDERGNNATPTETELTNCSTFLRQQIDLVAPRIIATLGARALSAVARIDDHGLELSTSVATFSPWYQRLLFPLYHPGARAAIHRSFALQLGDYEKLAEELGEKRVTELPAIQLAAMILNYKDQPISYFALHKLFYLIEAKFFLAHQRRLTDAYLIRQKNGPYVTDLHIKKLVKHFAQLRAFSRGGELYLATPGLALPSLFPIQFATPHLHSAFVESVLRAYYGLPDTELKTAAYLTTPMRRILRHEKRSGIELNRAIVF